MEKTSSEAPVKSNGHSTREIQDDIRRTRADMDVTLEKIAERLNVRHILDEVLDAVVPSGGRGGISEMGEAGKKGVQAVGDYLKRYPMPAALIGAGLAWAAYDAQKESHPERFSSREASAKKRAQELSTAAGEGLERAKSVAGSQVGHAASAVRSGASQAAERLKSSIGKGASAGAHGIRSRGASLGSRLQESTVERPLAVAVCSLATGLIAGTLLPRTKTEDELMGDYSDKLTQDAKRAAAHAVEQGRQAVSEAGSQTNEQREGSQSGSAKDSTDEIVERAMGAAERTTGETEVSGVPEEKHQGKAGTISEHAKEPAKEHSATRSESLRGGF